MSGYTLQICLVSRFTIRLSELFLPILVVWGLYSVILIDSSQACYFSWSFNVDSNTSNFISRSFVCFINMDEMGAVFTAPVINLTAWLCGCSSFVHFYTMLVSECEHCTCWCLKFSSVFMFPQFVSRIPQDASSNYVVLKSTHLVVIYH